MNKNAPKIENLISCLQEFDYIKNGKSATVDFLAYMIQCMLRADFSNKKVGDLDE